MGDKNELVIRGEALAPSLRTALALWSDATTSTTSRRRRDLLRDKQRAAADFFQFVSKAPEEVKPADVKSWQVELEARGLAHSTVYAMVSKVSSFYRWAMANNPRLAERIGFNPVKLARPRAPKPYETAQALKDEELVRLFEAVPDDTLSGLRDRALLLFYLLTGHRREEVIRLRWGDINRNGKVTINYRNKGGDYTEEAVDPRSWRALWHALRAYLQASGRLEGMESEEPLWVRHDPASRANGNRLTSHAFAKRFKRYARQAGLGDLHLHQLRHTYGRIVAEESGDLTAVQTAMGHKNIADTRVYVPRVTIKSDKYSHSILQRLELDLEEEHGPRRLTVLDEGGQVVQSFVAPTDTEAARSLWRFLVENLRPGFVVQLDGEDPAAL